ncbi:peptide chain release factor N(5)-glutamine methyltransferase [Paenibacillus marinisediminis]
MMQGREAEGTEANFRLEWPCTIREAWVQASSYLSGHGVADGPHHAELLLRHALQWERTRYLMGLVEPLAAEVAEPFAAMMMRRAAGEPTQYIMGEAWFYGLRYEVSADVLIPRPETELLVEAVLAEADRLWGQDAAAAALRVADIGTGSGAIACTLAHERPQWRVSAVDISPAALAVAQRNAELLGVAAQLEWLEGDLLAPLDGRALDILVSNPPYIPASDIPDLQREVRDFEPHTALVGGADGLDPYRRMADTIARWNNPPLLVAFELGMGQAPVVADLVRAAGYREIRIITDLAGIDRHVLGIRS